MSLISQPLDHDPRILKYCIFKHLHGGNEENRHLNRGAAVIVLLAGLLLISVFIPSLASAQTAETSRAVSVPRPGRDSGSNESEILFDEQESTSLETSVPPALLKYLEDKQCADIDSTASLLLAGIEIAKNAGYTTPDPLLLACLAKPETNFNDGAVGHAGELGLLQVHPCHARSMQRLGLDFHDSADRVAYACVLWNASGLRPWSTRRAAQRDYRAWSAK